MSTCSRCGNQVEFRYINGRCIPLHRYGGCIGSGQSSVNDYSGFRTSHESTCFSTNCPECGEEVFFIRHNGGSVWIDPPLGPPWFKHDCFDQLTLKSVVNSNLASSYKLSNSFFVDKLNLTVGIIKTTYVDYRKTYTEVTLQTGSSRNIGLKIKNNAGFLIGKLCIYDEEEKIIYPIENISYKFNIFESTDLKPKKV